MRLLAENERHLRPEGKLSSLQPEGFDNHGTQLMGFNDDIAEFNGLKRCDHWVKRS